MPEKRKAAVPGRRIGRMFIPNLILLGLTSLFMDMSSEIVYPLIPLYLAGFGATPAVIGLIEGIAESLSAFLKVFSGWWGDRTGREKQLTVAGYSASLLYKLLLYCSTGWGGVLAARIADRVGKGVRTAPRDALVAASNGNERLGHSFGLHKMLDMLGSTVGVLLALLIVWASLSFQTAFLISLIPAILGILAVCLVRQSSGKPKEKAAPRLKGFRPNGKLTAYLVLLFIFCIGNSSNSFLLLRASSAGLRDWQVILVYFLFNITASLFAYPFGRLSDKAGRGRMLVPGYLLYGLIYLGFAFLEGTRTIPVLFVAYGLYTALTSGAERAFIVEQAPAAYKGTMLGLYGMCQGFGLLLASLLAGGLWNRWGAGAPFVFGGVVGIVCAAGVGVVMRLGAGEAKTL